MKARDHLILLAGYAAWAAGDLDAMLTTFSEDVLFIVHLPRDVVPFAGEHRGKATLRAILRQILETFEIVYYSAAQIAPESDRRHSQVDFLYRHRATGLEYEGSTRHIWRVERHQIVYFEEYHDTERMRSYFNLLATHPAS
ncbi:MAG: nuclear transport factor 2 family protein [Hyphomicrobiaceae bacterium]